MIKPKIGEPCNGCGLCCMTQCCRNGAFLLGLVKELGDTVEGKCPALIQKIDKSYACGILLNPNKYIKNKRYTAAVKRRNFALLIGAGSGCDQLLPDDSPEEEEKLDLLLENYIQSPGWKDKMERALYIVFDQNFDLKLPERI